MNPMKNKYFYLFHQYNSVVLKETMFLWEGTSFMISSHLRANCFWWDAPDSFIDVVFAVIESTYQLQS